MNQIENVGHARRMTILIVSTIAIQKFYYMLWCVELLIMLKNTADIQVCHWKKNKSNGIKIELYPRYSPSTQYEQYNELAPLYFTFKTTTKKHDH